MKPYAWVPSLYFAEAVPYMAVMVLSTIMYTRLGLSNTELALYTSWLYLPWVIKPLWSPLVDALRTKRWWILSMQILVGASLAGVAFSLSLPAWLQWSLAFFWLMAFSSATHDIAADGFYILALNQEEQALYVGIRSTFYRIGSIFCQGALVVLAGLLEQHTSIGTAWQTTMACMAALMVLVAAWHRWALPCPEQEERQAMPFLTSLGETFVSFWQKPALLPAVLFMLLFRLPEAQLAKMAQPFMLRATSEGGLGLDTATVGVAYGTIGVIGLLAGGILGGWLVSRHGLKRWLWPMVLSISLPDAVYVYLASFQPTNIFIIDACVAVEQLGYGFGFTAYSLFMVYFARGEKSTSVFSLCTALQALGMMIPGMWAGWLADEWGFTNFFLWVCGCTLVTFFVSAFVRMPDDSENRTSKKWLWVVAAFVVAAVAFFTMKGCEKQVEIVPAEIVVEPAVEQTDSVKEKMVVEEPAAAQDVTPDVVGDVPSQPSATLSGDLEEDARQVIRGTYGNGHERRTKLGSAYPAIQKRVNELYRLGRVHRR